MYRTFEVELVHSSSSNCFDLEYLEALLTGIFLSGEIRQHSPERTTVMPVTKYSPEQIVTLLRQIELEIRDGKKTAPQACKEAGITQLTYWRWSQLQVLETLIKFARKSPRRQLRGLDYRLAEKDWYWKIHSPGKDRTAYLIGLFGSGRMYLNEVMQQNIGERAKYFRHGLRPHSGPTSLIHSGHATIKHPSRFQVVPAVTSRILEAVTARTADLIFVYRHPLDSLLTNWVWWRTYLRDNIFIPSISEVFKNTDELCAGLEQDFLEFKAFAEGDPNFFRAVPGSRFLSFKEFIEETELYLQAATLSLRFENFAIDPLKEFSKIVEVMSVDLDVSRLRIDPPKSKPYGYLAVVEKVPRFRDFIKGLDADTTRRIEKIGYNPGA
jgi:hypothetical protein